jgi:hypothetical protein
MMNATLVQGISFLAETEDLPVARAIAMVEMVDSVIIGCPLQYEDDLARDLDASCERLCTR